MSERIDFWLHELVFPDSDRRIAAARGVETLRVDYAEAGRYDDFEPAIRAAVDAPDFPKTSWLNALIDLMLEADQERMAAYRRADDKQCDRWSVQNIGASMVFGMLDDALLEVPDRLWELLNTKPSRWKALKALERLGPRAAPLFADALMERDEDTTCCVAVARMIVDDPVRIRRVVARLRNRRAGPVRGALETLGVLGVAAREAAPECVDQLLEMLDRAEWRFDAIQALGTVTAGTDRAVGALLELSYSEDVWTKGACLWALGDIAVCPDVVVPRLIAALDDYQEPDSDYRYDSEHYYVCRSLQRFGPAAAPAVPALMQRLVWYTQDENEILDKMVVRALGAIGPAAAVALPILVRYAEPDLLASAVPGGDDSLDYIECAIVAIRGGSGLQ